MLHLSILEALLTNRMLVKVHSIHHHEIARHTNAVLANKNCIETLFICLF
jgi:hypothetical protein